MAGVKALAAIGDKRAEAVLLALINNPQEDPGIKKEAALGLGELEF